MTDDACFEDAVTQELGVWYVCTSPTCGRVLRFGDPLLCPMCGAQTRMEEQPAQKEFVHGTRTAYSYYNCRCTLCRQGNADYRRAQVAANREHNNALQRARRHKR